MMYRRVILAAGIFLASQGVFVEQDLFGQFISPEVHADRTVTFRLEAPQAEKVLVQGLAGVEAQALVKSANGAWEVTLGPLTPELYSYTFSVDGAVVTDPHNRHVKKWLTVESLVEVPGDPPLTHQQQCVPHGVVHHHTYLSRTTGNERGVYVFANLLKDVAATNDDVKLLWIGCGKEDFLLERNQEFHTWLSEQKIDHTMQWTDGGHDWMVWRKYLAEFLPQLFR